MCGIAALFALNSAFGPFNQIARYDPLLWRIVCFGAWVKRFNVDMQ